MSLQRSPLHEVHDRLGARFVAFGEWEMPLQYRSVIAEHMAVRERCGWFDVSHLGRFRWEGEGATDALLRLLCNDIRRIEPGRAQYSMMLDDAGGVMDDLIIWRWGEDAYTVLPNAANHRRVMDEFLATGARAEIEDLRPTTVALAVQGPEAPAVLERVLGEAPARFRLSRAGLGGIEVMAAGTGYTGERGGELVVAREAGGRLVQELTAAGAAPCGLGARDTLRLEAGLPLWGNDLHEGVTPLEAGLDFAVSFTHDFRGRQALEQQLELGLPKRLVAFTTGDRKPPRAGYRLRADGSEGSVTSGNFSPVLQAGIGMGYLEPPSEAPLEMEIRGSWTPVRRVRTPFVPL